MSPHDFDFAEVLGRMVEIKASDVHITPNFPPAIRDKGKIQPMEGFPVLNGQQTREIVYGILNDDQRKRFENNQQLDFAYAIPGVARFRVNCYFQRGAVSAAFRPLDLGSRQPMRPSIGCVATKSRTLGGRLSTREPAEPPAGAPGRRR